MSSNTYKSSFVDPYPNGWKNRDESETTPIDADAMQAHTDAIKEIDNFLNGVNKDKIGQVQKSIVTKEVYNNLPDTKYTDGVLYLIINGGSGTVSYPNYESERF